MSVGHDLETTIRAAVRGRATEVELDPHRTERAWVEFQAVSDVRRSTTHRRLVISVVLSGAAAAATAIAVLGGLSAPGPAPPATTVTEPPASPHGVGPTRLVGRDDPELMRTDQSWLVRHS